MAEKSGNDVQLTKRNVKNIMHSVNGRVSGDAAIHMAFVLEQQATKMTRAAQIVARAAGRETIKEEDIRKAERVNEILDGGD